MIIRELQTPVELSSETYATPYCCVKMLFGYVDGVPYKIIGYGPSMLKARKDAEDAWESYKKSHYGPNVHIETIRDEKPVVLVDKYKVQE